MDQLSVDNACRAELASDSSLTQPAATATPDSESNDGPASEATAPEITPPGKEKRQFNSFDELTAMHLKVLSDIVRAHAGILYRLLCHYRETDLNSGRLEEIMDETREILHVCDYQWYLKNKSEEDARWARNADAHSGDGSAAEACPVTNA